MKFQIENLISPFLHRGNAYLGVIMRAVHYNITHGGLPADLPRLQEILECDEEMLNAIFLEYKLFVKTEAGFYLRALSDEVLKNSMTVKKRRSIIKKVDEKRFLIKSEKHV